MQRTNIYLEERQTSALDELARRLSTTRAQVIRTLIDHGLRDQQADADGDVAAIEASFGICTDDELAEFRQDSPAREQHLTRLWNG